MAEGHQPFLWHPGVFPTDPAWRGFASALVLTLISPAGKMKEVSASHGVVEVN